MKSPDDTATAAAAGVKIPGEARSVGTWQSVKNTSLTSRPPIVSIPRISRPSISPGTEIIVNPWCLSSPRVVRHTTTICSAMCAPVIHVFWPLIT